jgi:hypothetical protein
MVEGQEVRRGFAIGTVASEGRSAIGWSASGRGVGAGPGRFWDGCRGCGVRKKDSKFNAVLKPVLLRRTGRRTPRG